MRTQRHLWTRYFRIALLPVRPLSENELPGFFESNRRGIRRDHGPSSFGVTRNDPLGFAISRLPARPSHADSRYWSHRQGSHAVAGSYYTPAAAIARLTLSSSAELILASNSLSDRVEGVVD